ncbi:MAG TPA: hypothetical protein VMH35_25310 [Streptosporangiaceae bacterium]|nr:hypothetical protein [Streptosporangiaceae bacterium]
MPFDETRYVQEFIKKLRGTRSLPDDLLARYAITLPARDAEIAAQLKAVRAYWNKAAAQTAFAGQAAKMCRADDERLRAKHGAAMETSAWWTARQAERRSAAEASITSLAGELRQRYGQLGVVTAVSLDSFAGKLGLTRAETAEAVKQAGLTLVQGVTLPGTPPMAGAEALLKHMAECAVSSIPELVHPAAGPFSLIERYACRSDPNKRLDVLAVDAQLAEADKWAISATENARRAALKILRKAVKDGVDLRDLALYHLVTIAREYVPLSMSMAAAELQKTGLERHDATVIAVVLADQDSASSATGLRRVQQLLASAQLSEARQAALSLPDSFPQRAGAIRDVDAAAERLAALLGQARQAQAVPDEARAQTLLREAALISAADAEEALAAVPLAPPAGLRAVCEGSLVRLSWQASAGHDDGTSYLVTRTGQRPPVAPNDGAVVHEGHASSCDDPHAPVARQVQYGVFALTGGRPSSRPAVIPVTLLPPVARLEAESGPSELVLHWSAHPDVHAVQVTRTPDGGQPSQVPVTGNSCQLTGLIEGQEQYFEVVATYRGLDGTQMRSVAERLKATPRSEARPIPRLRVRALEVAGRVRARIAWTPVDSSEVHIRRAAGPPPWPFGTWVSQQDMMAFGQEVTGRRVPGRNEAAIEADLPPGVHHLVPFSAGGTGIIMGRPAAVGITDPVRRLVVTPFASYATVSWEWPATAQLAELSWEMGNDADCVTIGQAQYRSQGGARVPLGRGPCAIEVRAVIIADGVPFPSPPVRAVVDGGPEVTVGYTVSGPPGLGPFGGRARKVVFRSDQGCAGVQVRMVALPGRVMPTRAEGGFVLLDTTLTLQPGVPAEHSVTVPRSVRRPYWVRCFVVGGRARLVDPPVASLKEA